MSKVELDRVESGYGLVKINANFQRIQDEFNQNVLYRNNPVGEPNSMESTLDMNGQDLINIGTLSVSNLDISGVNLADQVALAQEAAIAASADAESAAISLAATQAAAATAAQEASDAADSAADAAASAASIDLSVIVQKDSSTGAAFIPSGTTAERPVSPTSGYTRFNIDLLQTEVYNGTTWVAVGAGASGGVSNPFVYENDITVTVDYTMTTNKNGVSAGPITIADGVTVTIPDGSVWTVVGG